MHAPATTTDRTDSAYAQRPYPRGYTAPSSLRPAIAAAHRTRWWLTSAAACADHLIAYALALGAAWVTLTGSPLFATAALAVAGLGIGRQLRALECLVHEGSHFNWQRHRRRYNDVLSFALAGVATGARISDYRESHLKHHGRFGTADDPDRRRYVELRLEDIRRDSRRAFAWDVLVRLPAYQVGWWRLVCANPFAQLMPLGGAVLAGVPTALLLGPGAGVVATMTWLASWLLVLPVIRLVGESSEHVYTKAATVFDATVSNLGRWQRLLVHPHGDGYHTTHHLWPGVPHHQLRRLHRAMLAGDPEGYARRLRQRTRLLARPERRESSAGWTTM